MLHVPLIDYRNDAASDSDEINVRNIETPSVRQMNGKRLKGRPESLSNMLEV
jgi:hypothetical protein